MKSLTTAATLMLLVFLVGCMSFMARNSPNHILKQGEWNTRSTQHFVFYFRPGSWSEQQIGSVMEGQERNYTEILALLQISDPNLKMNVFIFPSLEEKARVTSSPAYAHTISNYNTVYCIDSDTIRNVIGKHEVTHLLAYKAWGFRANGPFAWIVDEGIAVWSDGHWSGTELFEYMRVNLAKGDISTPYDFVMNRIPFDQKVHAYPVAGAFVKYLIQQYGLEKVTQLYKEGKSHEDFSRIFGVEFPTASKQFMEFIKAQH